MAYGVEFGILHLIGRDRTGILQDASAFVKERGGMTEEGISHTLRTEAVVLLVISGSPEQLDFIEKDAPKLGESLNMLSLFTRIKTTGSIRRDALPLTLRMSSPDFAGLLAAMTLFFSRYELPIIAHHTHKSKNPVGTTVVTYRHRFTVLLPPKFDRKKFLAELDELAEQNSFMRDDISHSDFY